MFNALALGVVIAWIDISAVAVPLFRRVFVFAVADCPECAKRLPKAIGW